MRPTRRRMSGIACATTKRLTKPASFLGGYLMWRSWEGFPFLAVFLAVLLAVFLAVFLTFLLSSSACILPPSPRGRRRQRHSIGRASTPTQLRSLCGSFSTRMRIHTPIDAARGTLTSNSPSHSSRTSGQSWWKGTRMCQRASGRSTRASSKVACSQMRGRIAWRIVCRRQHFAAPSTASSPHFHSRPETLQRLDGQQVDLVYRYRGGARRRRDGARCGVTACS
mmetsp:Transcript_46834/g.105600  ORF Transcript_46834/g.105600 Transcript_46834/m.105600 type:complete len:224 (+) Transcript_46834:539-1210(+)